VKRYYSCHKPYTTRKRLHLLYRLSFFIAKLFTKKSEIRFKEPLPEGEGVLLLSNHARDYGGLGFAFNYKRKFRAWINAGLLFVKRFPDTLEKDTFPNAKGFKRKLLRLLAYIIAPPVTAFFRAPEGIPTYFDMKVRVSFEKTVETLRSGIDVLIFPESEFVREDKKYINRIKLGFLYSLDAYYKETGKLPKIYPVYCCKDLHIISIGNPIEYDPEAQVRANKEDFGIRLENAVEGLALELPPHRVTPNGEVPEGVEILPPKGLKGFLFGDEHIKKD